MLVVQFTMTFRDLLDPNLYSDPGQQQRRAADQFPSVVRQSQMGLWQPGADLITGEQGVWIAVASYVVRELRLLDALEVKLSREGPKERIYLFDLSCAPEFRFEKYLPAIDKVYQTPVIANWTDGILRETLQGAAAWEWLVRRFGLSV